MRYANILYNDVVNTDGVSLTFYTQGCTHHCKGCFQPQTWDFNGGMELTEDITKSIEYCLKNYKYDYLCLLGGEPLDNIDTCKFIIDLCKKYQPNIKVWLYTGYLLKDNKHKIIENDLDVIIEGEFIQELYNPKLKFMGSSNQQAYVKENGVFINKNKGDKLICY